MARRGRNEGSIRWIEKKQLWEARYPAGTKPDGSTHHKSIYGKKNEKSKVLSQMRDKLAALEKGEYVDQSSKTLIVLCKEWYELYKEPKLKTNTREKYKISLKRVEGADIANMKIKDIIPETIQRYYNSLRDKYSTETIKATHSVINGALGFAEDSKMINKNPASRVIIPKGTDEDKVDEVKALAEEEYTEFMRQIANRSDYYMFALFTSNTGLRPGEAIALNRSDVDLINKKVTVNKTFVIKNKSVQNSPKTKSSKRVVPIPDNIIKLLKEYMIKQKYQKKDSPLFQTIKGTRYGARNILTRFKKIGEDIGAPWINLHTMRHTYASRLFAQNVDIKIISKLLGHKKISTTYDEYVHFINNVVDESVNVLNSTIPETMPEKKNGQVVPIKYPLQNEKVI